MKFEDGKINVLIGPSGCGKTTTMKMLNRLIDFTDGDIMLNDTSIKQMKPIELRRKMGYVIQNIGLFPHMTIYNNVATVPKLLKWDKQKIRQRVSELLEMVNLDPETYMNRYPAELSGGQQQRIGVIRALAAEPDIILMDEPFSALDPISREQLQDELVRLQANIHKTIIFVTHDMDEALKIGDQIILMKEGHVIQQASPSEITAHPANDFVKDFIGEKRLGQNQQLPPLSELTVHDYLEVEREDSVTTVKDKLIAAKQHVAPVVDNQQKYCGFIRLYDVLTQTENDNLHDIVVSSQKVLYEDDAMDHVVDVVRAVDDVVAVVDDQQRLQGLLDVNQLFKAMSGHKSGVA